MFNFFNFVNRFFSMLSVIKNFCLNYHIVIKGNKIVYISNKYFSSFGNVCFPGKIRIDIFIFITYLYFNLNYYRTDFLEKLKTFFFEEFRIPLHFYIIKHLRILEMKKSSIIFIHLQLNRNRLLCNLY